MTAARRQKDLAQNIRFGVDHELSPSSVVVGMSGNGRTENRQGQFDGYPDLLLGHSKSGDDASSLEGDYCSSPKAARSSSSGPALPPLHPSALTSVHSQPFSRRCRTLSSDTMTSTGSSIVSIDAGKHGFITHDDSSATGSLVLAYEQGKEIPPAEYDLPNAILGINVDNPSVGYSVESEEEFQKLPYQIRSRLSLSQYDKEDSPPDNRRWSNIPDLKLNSGYGAMEEGLMDIRDRVAGNYPSPGSTAANTMCYSTETSPFLEHRGDGYPQYPRCLVPEQLQMPMQANWVLEENLPSVETRPETGGSQASVYLSMLLVMVLFVGMIYGLFAIMKIMA